MSGLRAKEKNGFRLTTKRKDAIEKARSMGFELNTDIFKNPITQAMSVDELVAFSQTNAYPQSIPADSVAFYNNIATLNQEKSAHTVEVQVEEFASIEKAVNDKFKVMEEIVLATAMGINPSLIISGNGGIGKSFEVMRTVESLDTPYKLIKGKITPAGLYKLLYENSAEGSTLIFDDSDNIFDDELSMNLLKASTDSSDERMISWHSSREIFDEDGEAIPSDFIFSGNIIFISNIDIYKESTGNNKMATHFQALISRSFVLDLSMKNEEHFLARVKHVLYNGMNYDMNTKDMIFDFMWENRKTLREVTLRMVKKLSILIDTYGNNWQEKSKILLCK